MSQFETLTLHFSMIFLFVILPSDNVISFYRNTKIQDEIMS